MMGQNIDGHVLDSDGDPISGVKVKVSIDGIWKGGIIEEYTDDEGHASMETADEYEDSRQMSICVREQWFGPYYLSDGAFTVTLD